MSKPTLSTLARPVSLVAILVATVASCGGKQEPRGRAFCESYEQNYIPECRRHCESDLELGDEEGVEGCKAKCVKDLKSDDTYSESCVK